MVSAALYDSQVSAASGPLILRKATMSDIHDVLKLVNAYAANGIMLPRTEFEMSENIRDFSVAYIGTRLAGCGALHFYTPTSAEVRSLAVDPTLKSQGVGRRIIQHLEGEALENGLHAIFAFTYVKEFFQKLGFHEVERGELPLKVWKDCVRCPKFQCCDEIAMLKELRAHPILSAARDPDNELIQLPNLKLD
ncbi:MAG TPA: N-acetyltransferase [Bryobacteraceae bacterium]|nr:N-acetyltransferase [Bryobacteraceae bacterium]